MSTDASTQASNKSQSPTQSVPSAPEPSFGWTRYAEQLNGRFAMIGFVSLLAVEFFTKQDFFSWIGIR